MTTGKTTALNRQTLVGKVMSLLLNTLSRLLITFLPRSKLYVLGYDIYLSLSDLLNSLFLLFFSDGLKQYLSITTRHELNCLFLLFFSDGLKQYLSITTRHEIKRRLLLGRKVMTNLDSIFKSRDIASKGLSSQGYGFSSGHVWV